MKTLGSLSFAVTLFLAVTAFAADKPVKTKPAANPAAPATPAGAKAVALPETVAVVEGVEIKKAELEAAFANILRGQNVPLENIPEEQKVQGYRMVLDDLIVDKLISKRAAEVKVTDEEVAARFNQMKGPTSDEEAKKQIEAAGQTLEKVKANIRHGLQQQHWIDDQIKGKDEVSDADAEEFYKKNPEQFKSPEQVRASHILVKVDADAKPEQVVEKQKAAQAIAERVKKGEAFDKLAKELSEDPSAKQNSGDLDFFGREQMVPEFSAVAFKMKKDEISEPVRSQFGYHVIKVTDRKDPETATLEKVKPQLVAYLKRQKKQTEIQKVVEEIRSKADVKVNLPPAPAPAPGLVPPPAN